MRLTRIEIIRHIAIATLRMAITAFALMFGALPVQLAASGTNDPNDIVEIVVQFRTPPSVALRLTYERAQIHAFSDVDFENRALAAHDEFHRQLRVAVNPEYIAAFGDTVEIFSAHHRLFNGVYMRVPAYMVELIAELPEVSGIKPHVTPRLIEQAFENYSNEHAHPFSGHVSNFRQNFFARPNFMGEFRQYLGMDYINHDMGITGQGVRVGIIDSGIWYDHPEFRRFQDPATGFMRGWERHRRWHWHGTAVAGAVIGIAPNVELWSYSMHFSGLIDNGGPDRLVPGMTFAAAMEAAHEDNMQVVNLSMGFLINHPFTFYTPIIDLAVTDGIVVVAAAGNQGHIGHMTHNTYFRTENPGNAPLAISVGAAYNRSVDALKPYSSRGPVAETFHIKPDIVTRSDLVLPVCRTFRSYHALDGTSVSAPVITGLAALLLEQYPNACPGEIRARIMNTAHPLPNAAANNVFNVGVGFAWPFDALTQGAFATVEHSVPVSDDRSAPWETRTMASLSFGVVFEDTPILPITIHNAGAGAWIPEVHFSGSHAGAELVVIPTGENTFTAQMIFETVGRYEGTLVFTNGDGRITIPFAARYAAPRTVAGFVSTGENFEIVHFGGAYVTLINAETGERTVTLADENGHYRFEGVPDGIYHVVGTMAGYEAIISLPLVVDGDDLRYMNLTLPRALGQGHGRMLLVQLAGLPDELPPGTAVRIGQDYLRRGILREWGTELAGNLFYTTRTANYSPWAGFRDGVGTVTVSSPGFVDTTAEVRAEDYVNRVAFITIDNFVPGHNIDIEQPWRGGTAQASPATAQAGEEITLTAFPDYGFYFEAWRIFLEAGGTALREMANPATFTMPDNRVLIQPIFVEPAELVECGYCGGRPCECPPEAFYQPEYQRLAAFFRYNNLPLSPAGFICTDNGIEWNYETPRRVRSIRFDTFTPRLTGRLDVSGFSALENVRMGCCCEPSSRITSLDVSNTPSLRSINVSHNPVTEMDVSTSPQLEWFQAYNANLYEISFLENSENLRLVDVQHNFMDLSCPATQASIARIRETIIANMDFPEWIDSHFRYRPQRTPTIFIVTRSAASTVPAGNMAIIPAGAQEPGTIMSVKITTPGGRRIVAESIYVTGVAGITITENGATFPMPEGGGVITVNAEFDTVPATSVADIAGIMWLMLAFIVASVVLWGLSFAANNRSHSHNPDGR